MRAKTDKTKIICQQCKKNLYNDKFKTLEIHKIIHEGKRYKRICLTCFYFK